MTPWGIVDGVSFVMEVDPCFNAATAMTPWGMRRFDCCWPRGGWLQCGHGDDTVGNPKSLQSTALYLWLQCGHDDDTVGNLPYSIPIFPAR